MTKPLTVPQLDRAIRVALAKQLKATNAFRTDPNPQVQAMYHEAKGAARAFADVLGAIEQRSTYLLEELG
jgi:hypothetical protein